MSEPTTQLEQRHAKLQSLLQDRKAKRGRASRVAYVCLDADLSTELAIAQGELDSINNDIEIAKHVDVSEDEAKADRRAGGSPTPAETIVPQDLLDKQAAAEQKVKDAEDAADEVTVGLTITALKSDEYDELYKANPPEDGNKDDEKIGAHYVTFTDGLVLGGITKVADRDGNPVDIDVEALVRSLTWGERQVLRGVALDVNRRTISVPFSVTKSSTTQGSGSKSKRRAT